MCMNQLDFQFKKYKISQKYLEVMLNLWKVNTIKKKLQLEILPKYKSSISFNY